MKKRLFIAVPLPPQARKELAAAAQAVRNSNQGWRVTWVDPEIYHCTLHFLGDVDEAIIPEVSGDVARCASRVPIQQCVIDHIGAFPSRETPSTLYAHVRPKGDALVKLHSDLADILRYRGIEVNNRPLHLHATLGRIKNGENSFMIPPIEFGKKPFAVSSVELMESTLTSNGPIYTLISSHAFTGAQP